MTRMLLMLLAVLCTACAAQPQGTWKAPDRADANFERDRLHCLALASQATQGVGAWSSDRALREGLQQSAMQQEAVRCMNALGYSYVSR